MLRQLARLGHGVPRAGPTAIALAVYADADDRPVAARESGTEGVACVDDAARALELYCDLWDRTRLPWTLRWCEGLLNFILAMQEPDGRFVNFILDWEGTPNRDGRTSVAGGAFWQARAVLALSRASRVLADDRVHPALQRGWEHVIATDDPPSDVRALHMMAAITLLEESADERLRHLLAAWSDEVVACCNHGMLMNAPLERGRPHLWGHIQEAVLAEAGVLLDRRDLLDIARRSARLVFAAVIDGGFDLPQVQPYDVASSVMVMSTLGRITGAEEYADRAEAARRWFDCRNPAARAVYDRAGGRVADGIDSGRVSTRSGAEANVVAAHALFGEVALLAHRLDSSEALPAGDGTESRAPSR